MSILANQRRSRLLELVRQRGFASLPDLVDELQVSESTIRRDLGHLEESGTARRTHGGVFYTGHSPKLTHFDDRDPGNWELKKAIARRAVELIKDGDALLLDGGTTTYEVARLLVSRPLKVVTNSLPVANLFVKSPQTKLIFVGGYIDPRTGVSLGPYAAEMLAKLHVDKTIFSVGGIHENGFYNDDLLLVETEQAMMRVSDEVIIVADSTKFGKGSLQLLCPLNTADHLVVDDQLTNEWKEKLTSVGVNVVLATTTRDRDAKTRPDFISDFDELCKP